MVTEYHPFTYDIQTLKQEQVELYVCMFLSRLGLTLKPLTANRITSLQNNYCRLPDCWCSNRCIYLSSDYRLSDSLLKKMLFASTSKIATLTHPCMSYVASSSPTSWIIDSGASTHLTGKWSLFSRFTPSKSIQSITNVLWYSRHIIDINTLCATSSKKHGYAHNTNTDTCTDTTHDNIEKNEDTDTATTWKKL